MSAKIFAFPIARHVTVVETLVLEYVERMNDPNGGIAYLQGAFEDVTICQRQCGLSDDAI